MTESQFETIFKEHFTYLSNVAFGIVKDEDDSYDVVQHVFMKLWDKRFDVDIDKNIKSYLYRATFNSSLNFIEKGKRIVDIDDSDLADMFGNLDEKNTDFLTDEVDNAIKKAVSDLPKKCQEVFSLSRFSEMSNREIAEHLNISIKGVEKHISRALRELRVKLKPYMNSILFLLLIEVGVIGFELFS